MKLFVVIYSYRDLELDKTIKDLYAKADSPKDIYCGVLNADDVEYKSRRKNVRIKNVDYKDYHGCCKACYEILTELYQGEDYIIKIDPHTRFAQGWDTYYKQFLGEGKIIASRCLNYYENGDLEDLKDIYTVPVDFNGNQVISLKQADLTKQEQEILFFQAGFFIAPASWVKKVNYDPYICMWGEETDLSMRSFKAGYKMFAVSPRIYHLYNRKNRKGIDNSTEFNILNQKGIKRTQIKLGLLPKDESIMQEWDTYGIDGSDWVKEVEKLFKQNNNEWEFTDPKQVVVCKNCGSKTFYGFGTCKWCYKDLKGSKVIKE